MNLRQLEVFYAVMKTGTITGASQMLHVTQPAVSATLRLAEKRLGVVLFDRVKGRLLPTREALRLQADAVDIYSRLQTLGRVAEELREGRLSELVIATSPTLANALLPQVVTQLRTEQPQACVMLDVAATGLAVEKVARREADLGIVYGPVDDPAVESQVLGQSRMVCAMPQGHPLARLSTITGKDLSAYPLIAIGPGSRLASVFRRAVGLEDAGKPAILMEGSSWFTALLFVAQGAGVALVDRLTACGGIIPGLTFRPFSPECDITLLMIQPLGRERTSASGELVRLIRAHLEKAAHALAP